VTATGRIRPVTADPADAGESAPEVAALAALLAPGQVNQALTNQMNVLLILPWGGSPA
jgi:hypothetical protein